MSSNKKIKKDVYQEFTENELKNIHDIYIGLSGLTVTGFNNMVIVTNCTKSLEMILNRLLKTKTEEKRIPSDEEFQLLVQVFSSLNSLSISGRNNLGVVFSSILALEKIIQRVGEPKPPLEEIEDEEV